MNAISQRPCSIQESIITSYKEVKMMREGKTPKRSWAKFKEKMQNEIAKEGK